ncbi:MAG: type II secretion system protein [Elusimicrobia bacterium]|nr:MAG: type II secretion system protein [Elusimicrobiota bacterium]
MPIAIPHRLRYPARGFSFIELLASLAILATLAAVALPLAETTVKRQKEYALRRALRDIRQGIDAYKQAVEAGQVASGPDQSGYPATLETLVTGIDSKTQPGRRMVFLRRLPRDPFAPDPTAAPAASWGKRAYAAPFDTPREGDDVFDVYSLSDQVGLNGLAYREW